MMSNLGVALGAGVNEWRRQEENRRDNELMDLRRQQAELQQRQGEQQLTMGERQLGEMDRMRTLHDRVGLLSQLAETGNYNMNGAPELFQEHFAARGLTMQPSPEGISLVGPAGNVVQTIPHSEAQAAARKIAQQMIPSVLSQIDPFRTQALGLQREGLDLQRMSTEWDVQRGQALLPHELNNLAARTQASQASAASSYASAGASRARAQQLQAEAAAQRHMQGLSARLAEGIQSGQISREDAGQLYQLERLRMGLGTEAIDPPSPQALRQQLEYNTLLGTTEREAQLRGVRSQLAQALATGQITPQQAYEREHLARMHLGLVGPADPSTSWKYGEEGESTQRIDPRTGRMERINAVGQWMPVGMPQLAPQAAQAGVSVAELPGGGFGYVAPDGGVYSTEIEATEAALNPDARLRREAEQRVRELPEVRALQEQVQGLLSEAGARGTRGGMPYRVEAREAEQRLQRTIDQGVQQELERLKALREQQRGAPAAR